MVMIWWVIIILMIKVIVVWKDFIMLRFIKDVIWNNYNVKSFIWEEKKEKRDVVSISF